MIILTERDRAYHRRHRRARGGRPCLRERVGPRFDGISRAALQLASRDGELGVIERIS